MIPLQYRLRESVRLEQTADGKWLAVSEVPLAVLSVNAAAARLLKGARGGASVADLAAGLGVPEERVLTLCEQFRNRGILDVARAPLDQEWVPSVTVIVPTRNRPAELDECLGALRRLDQPRELLEIIVVDDGSDDPAAIAAVAARHPVRLLVNETNRGQSYSRNRAARHATGEILAFVDSDCVPGPDWLGVLVPYFAWERVGAVGGRTVGYYNESPLDRYEEVASPLDMGKQFLLRGRGVDTFYLPTCNLLVRRSVYQRLGGLHEGLSVGEDVDLCWRLRAAGAYLVYAPEGVVRHKHPGGLVSMLRRRASYGTSEAALHSLHPEKRKSFAWSPAPLATTAALVVAVVGLRPRLLPACLAAPLWDGGRRALQLHRRGIDIPAKSVWFAVLRGHASMFYFICFHLVRYYLGLLIVAGSMTRGAWALAGLAAACSSAVDYSTRRPRLAFSTFLGYYLAEHLAYQAGVIAGCLKAGSFRSYLVTFRRRVGPAG